MTQTIESVGDKVRRLFGDGIVLPDGTVACSRGSAAAAVTPFIEYAIDPAEGYSDFSISVRVGNQTSQRTQLVPLVDMVSAVKKRMSEEGETSQR